MIKKASVFTRYKAAFAVKPGRALLFLCASLSLAGQAAAFNNPEGCRSGDFACRMTNVMRDGNLVDHISLTITGKAGPAQAFQGNGIAIGNLAKAGERIIDDVKGGEVAIGAYSQASGISAVALGARTIAEGTGAISLGRGGTSDGEGASALGSQSHALAKKAVAIGALTFAEAENAVAIGPSSKSLTLDGVAVGPGSNVDPMGTFGLALGRKASVKDMGENSVALGNESTADRPNSISVGRPRMLRQITNVADGVHDNDVVTVRQMKLAGCWVQ